MYIMLAPEEIINAATDAAAHSAAAADAWANSSMMGDEEAEAMAASVMPGISDSPPSPMATTTTTTTTKKRKGRKKKVVYKKNPYAPKRFKSSYICFFTSKRPDIKKELAEALGRDGTVAEVAKKSAEMWKNMSPEERLPWDEASAKDKQRYLTEKAMYTGDWKVEKKKTKKDSRAPKRPPSAFLYFSGERRSTIKEANPGITNTDISKELGRLWREMSDDQKKPYVDQEKAERVKYNEDMAHYKELIAEEEAREKEKRDEEQREFKEKVQQTMKMQDELAAKGGYNAAMLYASGLAVPTAVTTAATGNVAPESSEASTAAAAASAAAVAASANYYGYAPYPYYYPPTDGSHAVAAQAFAGAYAYPAAQQVQMASGQAGFQGGAPQVLGPSGMPQAYQAAAYGAYPGGGEAATQQEASSGAVAAQGGEAVAYDQGQYNAGRI